MFCKYCGKATENASGVCNECAARENGAGNAYAGNVYAGNAYAGYAQKAAPNPRKKALMSAILGGSALVVARMVFERSVSTVNMASYVSSVALIFLTVFGLLWALGAVGAAVPAFLMSYRSIASAKGNDKMIFVCSIVATVSSVLAWFYALGYIMRFMLAFIVSIL